MLSPPGRTSQSTMGAPIPSDPVELAVHHHHSRSGPVVGCGVGVSQPQLTGMYEHNHVQILAPDALSPSSVHQPNRKLRVYYQNVRGLRTKIDSFFLAILECDYDVVVLTETWLDDRIYSMQLFGDKFSVYRTDRNQLNSRKSRGGGVLIAVSLRFGSVIDPAAISSSIEQLWVRVKLERKTISIGVIYLPPDRRNDVTSIYSYLDSVGAVLAGLHQDDVALQFGDYNQPAVLWKANEDGLLELDPRSQLSAAATAFVDGMCYHGLTQINAVSNRNSRLLDLVFVNEPALGSCIVTEAVEPVVALDADHPALDIVVDLPVPLEFDDFPDVSAYDFRRVDFDTLCEAIAQIDWTPIDAAVCVDDAVNYFCDAINRVFERHVPLARPAPKPPWSNSHLRRLKRVRAASLRRYSNHRNFYTRDCFARASRDYRAYNRFLYGRYVLRTQADLRRNPKRFWSFVNSKRKEGALPSVMNLGNRSARLCDEKCNLFASHFQQAFNHQSATPAQVEVATQRTPRNVFDLRLFQVTENDVADAVGKLKSSSAVGPDGTPSVVLKKCSNVLLSPLVRLFNLSLQQGRFPSRWKVSHMFPVFKKGDKANVENYRGITSLCCYSKVFEIIMKEALFSSCKNYISTSQHGFYPKRSTNTNLTEFVSLCLRSMDSGGQVDAIYTDLKAAFDRVDHNILLGRLEKLGVSSNLIPWFRSYLTGRTMCVKIGNSQSEVFSNISGVPQGSNLGPLLFSLFINEVSSLLPPGCRLFYADDVKIFMIVNNIEDCVRLQEFATRFGDWCATNFVTLSIPKCNVISFHRKTKPIAYEYMISNSVLERVDRIRDLGVILDQELTFRPHYNEVISKANRTLGFIFKIADEFRDPLCLRALYCSLVRSQLEHCSVVWCPYQASWINRIESVQKKFVRLALRHLPWRDTLNLPPYEDRCRLLGIDTLENRRRIAQIVFTAKVLRGYIDSPYILRQLNLYAPERIMRQRNFLYLDARNRQYGCFEPIRAMASSFNAVYTLFDFHVSIATFVRRIT